MSGAPKSKSNAPLIVGTLVSLAAFSVVTFAVVEQAGGTDVSPDYSNTPNAVVPGPPAFKCAT